MTPLTLEQAKKIVLEKYPDAKMRYIFGATYALFNNNEQISDAKVFGSLIGVHPFTSAAECIEKEKV